MADVQIRFRTDSQNAKREINQLTKEIQELRQSLGQTDRTATAAAQVVDRLGDEAKEAAIGVTSLGRNIFKTSAEAKRFGGVFTDAQGRIREANGEFAKTRETIERLGNEARESAADVDKLGNELEKAGRGTSGFSQGVGGAGREAGVARKAIGLLGSVARSTLATFGAFAAVDISYAIGRAGVESVRAAGQMEQYLRATQQITGSAAAAEARIEDLVEIANLPGLNFEPLTRFSNRLLAAGVGAEDANKILLTVGQTIVSLGGSADKAALAMEQIIQAIQLGSVDFRDFRTIVQQIPGFLEALGDVHGVEANIDGLHEAFNRVGRNMLDLLIPTFDELARRFESPPPDSYIVTMDRLQNAFFLLQAEIGERLLPIVTRAAGGLADFFENITAYLDAPGSAAAATAEFTSSLDSLNESLSNVDSLARRNEAIQTHINLVEDQIETLDRFAQSEARRRGRQTFALRGVDPTTLRRDEDVAEILELQGELENLQGVLEGSALAIDYFQGQADDLSASVSLQQQELAKLTKEQRELAISGDTSSTTYRNLNADIIQANDVLEALRSELSRYSAIVRIAEDNANTYALTSQLLTASQNALTESIKAADEAFRDGAISYGEYVAAAARVRENIEALSGGQAALNDFWRIASGRVEDYSESIETTIPSIVNLTRSENALTAAIAANLQALRVATGDPLSDYIDTLTLTSAAADTAFGSINRVGEAVRNADFRRAEAELRDFDDAFSLSEATIPRVRSEMERFTGTLPDASRSIRDTTLELRNLSQEAQAAARDAEFLNASFAVLDAFDPRTPDPDTQRFDAAGFALRTGEELASQAIRTAGQLQRIERERVENLEDLEREYSETIVAINERKRQQLAAVEQEIETERLRRLASIQQAFDAAAEAEVEARQRAADRIQRIEARAATQRLQLRERLNDQLLELEAQRDTRIQDLTDGLIEREQDRQARILEITENASEARIAVEQRYADTVQAINNRLVEDVLAIQRGLQEEIASLESGFVQRQEDRASEIVRVTEEAADARAAANQTYVDEMQGIYNGLVEAWDNLEEGFTARQEARAQQRIGIEQNAAAARAAAYQDYTETVARISTDLVDEIRGIQQEITDVLADAAAQRIEIEQGALDARAEANAEYTQELEALESDRTAAHANYASTVARISTSLVDEIRGIQQEITEVLTDAAAQRIEIEQEALDARADANAAYVQQVADIEAERDRDIEENALRLTAIQQRSIEARLDADQDYADRLQGIQNDLVDDVVDIQEDLNDTLNALRDDALDAEQDRLDSLVELHESTQQRLEDLERNRTRTIEDLRQKFLEDQLDARERLQRDLEDADSDEDREEAQKRYQRRIQDLTQQYHRDILALNLRNQRQQEDLARQAAAREVQIAEAAAARKAEIAQQENDARTQAQQGIASAEAEAGVSFQEAQANYVPALSAHEQALLTHAEALQRISETERAESEAATAERARILQESFEAAATAGMTLAETLTQIESIEQGRLGALDTTTADTVSGLNQQITDAEGRTGLSFDEALENYTPAVDLNTQALNTLNETLANLATAEASAIETLNTALSAIAETEQGQLSALDTQTSNTVSGLNQQITDAQTRVGLSFDEALRNYKPTVDLNTQALNTLNETLAGIAANTQSELAGITAAGLADRASTTASQQALAAGAGVSIEDARANFVPALSSAAQATLTLNTSIQALDTSFQEAIAAIQAEGLTDQQATAEAIQAAVTNAIAQQTQLETQAGTTFADASLAFQPGLSDIGQAGVDRDAALAGITSEETEGIDAINAQSIADRLETDAQLTEARDTYIRQRDTAIFNHNAAILKLNQQEAADIKGVRAELKVNLTNIDEALDEELAEIRATKEVFDTRMNQLITSINEQANLDVGNLKEDTAAMRSSLEAIAEEARDNAWKAAILKVANVGITIAGVAVGAAVGAPQAGAQVGGIVGGLVEQGGNELFHFERTDRLARSIARQETSRRSRSTPNYLPDANQIRNARDVSREIVAGINEAQSQRGGGIGAQQPIEIVVQPNDIVLNEQVIGAVIDEVLVRLDQDGRAIGEYQRRAQ